MKAAEPKMPPPKPPAEQGVMVMDDPWHPMSTAPKTGEYVFLRGDECNEKEIPNEWFWYSTRQFRKGMWQATGWWSRRFGTRTPPSFTPSGWRGVKEGMPQ